MKDVLLAALIIKTVIIHRIDIKRSIINERLLQLPN